MKLLGWSLIIVFTSGSLAFADPACDQQERKLFFLKTKDVARTKTISNGYKYFEKESIKIEKRGLPPAQEEEALNEHFGESQKVMSNLTLLFSKFYATEDCHKIIALELRDYRENKENCNQDRLEESFETYYEEESERSSLSPAELRAKTERFLKGHVYSVDRESLNEKFYCQKYYDYVVEHIAPFHTDEIY